MFVQEVIKVKQIKSNRDILVPKSRDYYIFKRFIDVCLSIIMLISSLPLLLVLGFLLFLDDGFPILFRQVRIGKDGQPFVIFKFRTMPINSSSENEKYAIKKWLNGVPDDFVFKSSNPHGISRLGRLMRKYSLDELPQLVNVITGKMSLIGPRPEVVDIVNYYNSKQMARLLVKPGITGYAQVNGRSHLNHGEKIACDRYYIENCSFKLDIIILVATVKKVIKANDSY